MEFRPLAPAIGAEVLEIDLAQPFRDEDLRQLRAAWLECTILLFRGQTHLRPEDIVAFSRRWGQIDDHDLPEYTLPQYPEIALVSNVKENGRYIGAPKAGRHWHSDSQYLKRPPTASFLYAKEVPPKKGETLFANMYAAYEALSDTMKRRIDGLKINHSRIRAYSIYHPERPPLTDEQQTQVPDVQHPLVRTHPETGRKALYVGGAQHGGTVVGMPLDKSADLIEELRAFATQPRFVYTHSWMPGDAILWDNRCTMHCATPFDEDKYRRIMYRTQIAGDIPV